MSAGRVPADSIDRSVPFSRAGVLGIVVTGFVAFAAMLYFLSIGDTGADRDQTGGAHAASDSLNGFSGLARLMQANGYEVQLSRRRSDAKTSGLLVLTPPHSAEAEEIDAILDDRAVGGPTLVILPKWDALKLERLLGRIGNPGDVEPGWVLLSGARVPDWAGRLGPVRTLDLQAGNVEQDEKRSWRIARDAPEMGGYARQGTLPNWQGYSAKPGPVQRPLIVDGAGQPIALGIPKGATRGAGAPNWIVFLIEPDLANNWGLADAARARAALRLVDAVAGGDFDKIVFDLTLNGLGGTVNLLTLAFRPPFLAATLCLLLAIVIAGWRAFNRFGPSAAAARSLAFGKARLVTNGADLIVRARRHRLLAEPYIALSARRAARALGLARPDPAAIDAALSSRLPTEQSFTRRADALRSARSVGEIQRAASALHDLTGQLNR